MNTKERSRGVLTTGACGPTNESNFADEGETEAVYCGEGSAGERQEKFHSFTK